MSRFTVLGVFGWTAAMMSGCAASKNDMTSTRSESRDSTRSTYSSEPRDDRAELRTRAESLWEAKKGRDWEAAFVFEDPALRKESTVAQFIEWSEKEEPFRIQSYSVGDVEIEKEMGWVTIDYETTLLKFPNIPPRGARIQQKWRKLDGDWYPVARQILDQYPEAPSARNTTEEPLLRSRFEEAWNARQDRNFEYLFELCDPKDTATIEQSYFVDQEALVEYKSCEVHWVEAIGEKGRIHCTVFARLHDPNMRNMPFQPSRTTENWVLREGEWYRDLRRP